MTIIKIKNLHELRTFAMKFARSLKGGEIIGLVGELGAGKTTLVQHLARALGVKKEVRSPTFIVMQCFDTGAAARKKGVVRLCHVDAYRLKGERELFAIGFDEYAGQPDTVTLVEWADKLPSLHGRKGYKEATIDFGPGLERVIRLD